LRTLIESVNPGDILPRDQVGAGLPGKKRITGEQGAKLEEAFVYQKAIDYETYKEMRANLVEELVLAERELRRGPGRGDRNRDYPGFRTDGLK
jgi:hypothetical protein